jgi:hypothetical protein
MDIGITNACIYQCLTNPQLKKNEGYRRRMMEDIARHMVAAREIDWEIEYGTETYNLEI